MDEIIREIIEIDKTASKKLEEAERLKDEVIRLQIEQENNKLRQTMQKKVENRLRLIREAEENYAAEKIEAINKIKEEQLQSLKECYEQNHESWESDLFSRVISR